MISNWKTLTLYSLLSAAMVGNLPQTILADDPKPTKDTALEDLSKNIGKLTKSIEKLNERIGELEKKKLTDTELNAINTGFQLEFKKIEANLLAKIDGKLDSLKANMANIPAGGLDKAAKDEMRSLIRAAIQEELAKVGPTEKRLSMSPPLSGAAITGRVRLRNLYSDELLFIVNGANYKVFPGMEIVVDNVPAGPLNYEVVWQAGSLGRQQIPLVGGETYTVTASKTR